MLLVVLALLVPLSHSYSVKDVPGTLCSSNLTNAYVDIYLVFDVSSNTDPNKLRQVTLSIASEFSKLQIAQHNEQGQVWHRSRVSIVTYASSATLIANITQYNSTNEFTTALLALQVSTDTSTNGLQLALSFVNNMTSETLVHDGWLRNPLTIVFASSLNGMNMGNKLANYTACFFDHLLCFGSLSTVNMNPTNTTLTNFLSSFMTPSMNFNLGDANLYTNIQWAIAQTNCECGTTQNFAKDPTTQRWTKYADCFGGAVSYNQLNPIKNGSTAQSQCAAMGRQANGYAFAIPNANRADWFNYQTTSGPNYFVPSSYMGLHRNPQQAWVWNDYDGTEFALADYHPWANGYNETSPGECSLIVNNGTWKAPFYWRPSSCLLTDTMYNYTFPDGTVALDYNLVNCQAFACGTDISYNCGWCSQFLFPNSSSECVKNHDTLLTHVKYVELKGKAYTYHGKIYETDPKLFYPLKIKL